MTLEEIEGKLWNKGEDCEIINEPALKWEGNDEF
jgi:hypothetical protein